MAGLQVNSKFVGEKVSSVRWLPDAGGERLYFATGSADNARHSFRLQDRPQLFSAHANHVKVWGMARPRRTRGTFEDGPTVLDEPAMLAAVNIPFDVHDLAPAAERTLLAATSSGNVLAFRFDETAGELKPLCQWNSVHYYGAEKHRGPCAAAGLSVAPSGRDFVTVGEDGRLCHIVLGDTAPSRVYGRGVGPAMYAVDHVKQDVVATVNAFSAVELFALKDSSTEPVLRMRNDPLASDEGVQSLLSIAAHPTQPFAILSGSTDGIVTVWDTRQPRFPVALTQSHESCVWDIRFHPTQTDSFFTCSEDGTLLHWNCNPRRSDQAEFTMSSNRGNLAINNLVSSASLGINSLDVHNDLVVCGTDNEALMFFSGLAL